MILNERDLASLIWNTMPRQMRVGKKDPADMTEKQYAAYCAKMARMALKTGEWIMVVPMLAGA